MSYHQIGYDDTFNNKFGGNAAANAYWTKIWTHLQAHFCHSSLGSQVKVSALSVTHLAGKTFKADEASESQLNSYTAAELKGADLMVYLAYDASHNGPGGIAALGTVCKTTDTKWKQAIAELQDSVALTSIVIHRNTTYVNLYMIH